MVMKVIFSDFKKGSVKLRITTSEDVWHLSQIIETGDIVSGRTLRKVTIGSAEGKTTHVQKPVYLKIVVERAELAKDALRVSGKIIDGPDDVSHGSYHTFTVEKDTEISIEKQEWLSLHKAQLKDAEQAEVPVIVCVFDRDDALIARSYRWGMEILARLRGDPERKDKRANTRFDLYKEIINLLGQYDARLNPQHIILASPAFYKEDLYERMSDKKLKSKIILATCSSANDTAIHEVLRRPETQHAFRQMRVAQEIVIVDKLLVEIAKQGNATYGFDQVKMAADAGAISDILITSLFVKELQESGNFKVLNDILKHVDRLKGTIHIISTEHEAGKKLQGLGGIAALLRYNLEW